MARARDLATMGGLAPSVLQALHRSGFRTTLDVLSRDAQGLAQQTGIKLDEAETVIALSRRQRPTSEGNGVLGQTAASLRKVEKQRRPLITFCKELDRLLGGGVAPAALTEFCGVPGSGKTQLAIQIAVDATIPRTFGGAAGEAIIIDTEGSFMPERARQVAAALLDHISRIGKRRGGEHAAAAAEMGIEKTLRSIHIVRCHDAMEQVAAIKALPSLLDAREGRVRAIIVDSMAFHFRHDSVAVGVAVRKAVARAKGADERTASEVSPLYRNENFGGQFHNSAHRARLLASLAAELNQLASQREVAVVLVNQMTTKAGGAQDEAGLGRQDSAASSHAFGSSRLVPALGAAWAHAATHRVLLRFTTAGQREAKLFKSASRSTGSAIFEISSVGVRDPPRAGADGVENAEAAAFSSASHVRTGAASAAPLASVTDSDSNKRMRTG